ncbi:TerC/Alx family metal homeostasis membrane protein, partial [Candidatus Peregrinibacteria bacterium]|nr:TerC/Alx family metal homeostasis membrane protein [Candidatus Peregrinibacteria bacterium]
MIQNYLFLVFTVTILGFLVVDLGFLNRSAHRVGPKSALIQSLFWIAISFAFAFLVFLFISKEAAAEFMSAYVTEKMLSVDNLFVIMLIFNFFKIDEKYHHKVLFWGILGAVIFRGIFITSGAFIISQFHWVLYIFGAVLIFTGIKLFRDKKEEHIDFNSSKVVKVIRKVLPFTASHHNGKFIVRENGKTLFTTLFLIVLLVETTDIIFAIDSIPAAFAISQDPFIVFTSNIFAVMGLRALFFLIENILHKFHHLQKGLSFILIFIG